MAYVGSTGPEDVIISIDPEGKEIAAEAMVVLLQDAINSARDPSRPLQFYLAGGQIQEEGAAVGSAVTMAALVADVAAVEVIESERVSPTTFHTLNQHLGEGDSTDDDMPDGTAAAASAAARGSEAT